MRCLGGRRKVRGFEVVRIKFKSYSKQIVKNVMHSHDLPLMLDGFTKTAPPEPPPEPPAPQSSSSSSSSP